MRIPIDPHTLERAEERGTSKEEIQEVIETGIPVAAKRDRLSKAKVFDFGQIWNNKFYNQKRVQAIYTIEQDTIITITVYVFYGEWK